jgi:hypothetical protein
MFYINIKKRPKPFYIYIYIYIYFNSFIKVETQVFNINKKKKVDLKGRELFIKESKGSLTRVNRSRPV